MSQGMCDEAMIPVDTQTRCRVTWSVRLLDVDDRRSRQGSLTMIERDVLSHFATS